MSSGVKTWKEGAAGEPKFPAKFSVVKKAVLQKTDIGNNNNKYYAIEIHDGNGTFRVYTHYGRTDDLESNPNAGMRESRYCPTASEAEALYNSIYRQKTGDRKGYQQVNLASSKIGSKASQGTSCGDIDDKTLKKMDAAPEKKPDKVVAIIPAPIAELVEYLYSEAVKTLTTTVQASITANGIETPLGVLTLGQIEKGQLVLDQLAVALVGKKKDDLMALSGQFYTAIPHRIGRSRDSIQDAVIDAVEKLTAKNDTLQLMRDMLNVNGKTNVLISNEVEKKYTALNCKIECVDSDEAGRMASYAEKSSIKYRGIKVKNVWRIGRPDENAVFNTKVGNEKLLFHGSNVCNWVGILSRGILLPKAVVKLGVRRTDAGWLGSGIYFGDAICTSYYYAGAGRRGTKFISIARVALGKVKQYRKITYGLSAPPDGFDSCHGVRGSEFSDDEFVVYGQNQQKLEYLVECK